MENKNKRLHLKLTDNETGKTLYDADGCFILGAFCMDEHQTVVLVSGASSVPIVCLNALRGVEDSMERLYQEFPPLKPIYELYKALGLDKDGVTRAEFDMSALFNNKKKDDSEVQ